MEEAKKKDALLRAEALRDDFITRCWGDGQKLLIHKEAGPRRQPRGSTKDRVLAAAVDPGARVICMGSMKMKSRGCERRLPCRRGG